MYSSRERTDTRITAQSPHLIYFLLLIIRCFKLACVQAFSNFASHRHESSFQHWLAISTLPRRPSSRFLATVITAQLQGRKALPLDISSALLLVQLTFKILTKPQNYDAEVRL